MKRPLNGQNNRYMIKKDDKEYQKSRAVRYSLARTPNLPFSCPSLVYLADMYGIYKSNEPLLIKKTSFEVKHCKIETVFISRSAQAGKFKKTHI